MYVELLLSIMSEVSTIILCVTEILLKVTLNTIILYNSPVLCTCTLVYFDTCVSIDFCFVLKNKYKILFNEVYYMNFTLSLDSVIGRKPFKENEICLLNINIRS
jgi:hypothetical protein